MKVFEITAATTDPVKTDANGRAEAVFTVTNITSRPLRGLAKVKPLGNTKQEWLKLAGESERDYPAGATHQLTMIFDAQGPVPPGGAAAAATGAPAPGTAPAPGKYGVKVIVASASNPDEDFAENTATFEVAAREEKKKAAFPLWIIPVIAVALIVIGVTLWLILRNGKEVTVPAVRGQAKEEALNLLKTNCEPEPCFVINEEMKTDPTVAKDHAIGTEPAENETVAAGSEVTLFISSGPELVEVPPVNNQMKEVALTKLKAFIVNEVSKPDDTVANGRAIGTDPAENQMAPIGSTVTLFISSGPEMKLVRTYTGKSLPKATQQIQEDGFVVGNVTISNPGLIIGPATKTVIAQDPLPDATRPKGAQINLTVKRVPLELTPYNP